MPTLFDPAEREAILRRLQALEAGAARQWGKMSPAQMLAHCSAALELATSEQPIKQKLIGKILAPLVRRLVLGAKPFGHNSPTDPRFIVTDEREFAAERARLERLIARFCERGAARAASQVHVFFGPLSGEEWGTLMHKHLDHHLRQFAA